MAGGTTRERGRPARILIPCLPLEVPCDAALGHPAGGNRMGRPKQSPGAVAARSGWRRWHKAVPGLVRAGRPRSRVGFIQ